MAAPTSKQPTSSTTQPLTSSVFSVTETRPPAAAASADAGKEQENSGKEQETSGFQVPEIKMPEMKMPEMPEIKMPEMPKIDLPEMPDIGFTFEDFSALVVEKLSPIEQLSPFKVGQIQKLIADGDEEMGKKTAPYFALVLVVFLLAFVGYFVTALVALVLDAEAMDDECAEETYLWLYVFTVLALPTIVGFLLALIQSGLQIAFPNPLDKSILRVADMILAVPSPLLNLGLGVLGLALWGGMEEDCSDFYWQEYAMLLVVFYIQVALTSIGGLFGFLTLAGMIIGLINRCTASLKEITDKDKDRKGA